MTDYELKDFIEDLDDLLVKVEASFNIKFIDDELMHISTFGELCDLIAGKMQLENLEDCTSQQAFYKLRDAISLTLQIEKDLISPDYQLEKFLPRKTEDRVPRGLNCIWVLN